MAVHWNSVSLKRPSTTLSFYNSSQLKSLGDLNAIANLLEEISSTTRAKLKVVEDEMFYFSAFLYRMRASFRNLKYFKTMKLIAKCLKRFSNMELDETAFTLFLETEHKTSKKSQPSPKSSFIEVRTSLPSRQMFEFLLLQLQGLSKLMLRTLQYCQESFYFGLQSCYLGHNIVVVFPVMASVAKIWNNCRLILMASIKWYQTLYPFTCKLKNLKKADRNFVIAPGDSLPANIEDWLGEDYKDVLEQLPLAFPQ